MNKFGKNNELDIVCEGGGVKGVALLGALKELEDAGAKFRKVAGTSAGAIVASLIAVGYTTDEIKKEVFDNGLGNLIFGNRLNKILAIFASVVNVPFRKGFCNTKHFKEYLDELFEKKGKTTFKDVCTGEFELKMIASDITNNRLLILPDDLPNDLKEEYKIEDPMDFRISDAVIMSMSFPGYFMPYVLKYKNNEENKESYIVDGGLCSNFPIWIFDINRGTKPKCPTFGINLSEDEKLLKDKKGVFLHQYLFNMVKTVIANYEIKRLSEESKMRTINVPVPNISPIKFNLTEKQIKDLYESGRDAVKLFLNGGIDKTGKRIEPWDFDKYIKRFRNYEEVIDSKEHKDCE